MRAMLAKCEEPALQAVRVNWKMYNEGDEVNQAPLMIASLFNKNRQVNMWPNVLRY